jgi:hypothetical protein
VELLVFVLLLWVFSSEYLPMAVFVQDIDKLFDSYNSVKSAAPGKTLLSPLRMLGPYDGVLFVCGLSNPRAAGHFCLWLYVTTYSLYLQLLSIPG